MKTSSEHIENRFYDKLNSEFIFNGPSMSFDGLGEWSGQRIFVNPPHGSPRRWIRRAIEESKQGKLIVMLLRVDTATSRYQDLLRNAEIRFLLEGYIGESAPFANLIAVFRPKHVTLSQARDFFRELFEAEEQDRKGDLLWLYNVQIASMRERSRYDDGSEPWDPFKITFPIVSEAERGLQGIKDAWNDLRSFRRRRHVKEAEDASTIPSSGG